MTQEALKLALEALEANYLLVNGTETHGGLEQCLDGYYSACFDVDPINKQTEEAITAIKEALAQPEQEPVALQDDEIYDAAFSAYCRGENSRELFRIMWSNRLTCSIGWDRDELKSFARNIAALYTTPPQRTEQNFCPRCGKRTKDIHTCTPPQRTFVGLTEQERNDIEDYCEMMIGKPAFDAIEAKLKELNT